MNVLSMTVHLPHRGILTPTPVTTPLSGFRILPQIVNTGGA